MRRSYRMLDSCFGRIKILTNVRQITAMNICDVLSKCLPEHARNVDREFLLDAYKRGDQPILQKEKTVRPEINNKVVENRALEIVEFKTGYFLGEPVQYVARTTEKDEAKDTAIVENISKLNEYMMLEDKHTKDINVSEWAHTVGVGCRLVLPNGAFSADDADSAPFRIYDVPPQSAFVVYSASYGNDPLMGVLCTQDGTGQDVYSCYTKDSFYTVYGQGPTNLVYIAQEANPLGEIPLIEYPLNNSRLGAFEPVMPLLDAINAVSSDRLDGVDQFVQSFMKFINCDISEDDFAALKQLGAIKIKSVDGTQADVDIITSELNQTQTQTLKDDYYDAVLTICGMPNRNGGSSTSDTGSAVTMRDGWSAAEERAKATERPFVQAERQFLRVVLKIVRDLTGMDINLGQIDIKFTRRNYADIQTKAQVLTTMLGNDKIHPELAFTYCGMFPDPSEAYLKSEQYAKDQQEKMLYEMDRLQTQQPQDARVEADAAQEVTDV